ncbi:hypothetical protein C8J56DRAFT_1112945 [Mycena floridula]|nr:hypothetical protein C8J56DRAFT_1112945 [Mycena floridula]
MQRTQHERPHQSTKPLKRGKACLTCRFLKIKCDGARPICGPCETHPKDDPCEFTDGPGRSRTRLLEATITRLEERIRELEQPERAGPSMVLHDPYQTFNLGQPLDAQTPPIPYPSALPAADYMNPSPDSPFSPSSTLSSIYSAKSSPPQASISPASQASFLQSSPDSEDFSMHQTLVNRFMDNASECGFFLSPARTYSALISQSASPTTTTPALKSVIYLWGSHLCPSDFDPQFEHNCMLRALADTATNLSLPTEHPQSVLQTIQCDVLLAYYFFRIGKVLQAKYHASGAASLALACGLHRVRSVDTASEISLPFSVLSNGATTVPLPKSRDIVEEGEYINGFWTVVSLCKNLSVAFDPPCGVSNVFDTVSSQIDTPWPLDSDDYKEGRLPSRGTSTVSAFLNSATAKQEYEDYETSSMAMIAKASVLLHRATALSGQYRSNFQLPQAQSFYAAFDFLNRKIEGFTLRLPGIHELDARSSTRSIGLAHALTAAASIRLNSVFVHPSSYFSSMQARARQACLTSAAAMFEIPLSRHGFLNPMMGSLWVIACEVFVDELALSRREAWQHSTLQSGLLLDHTSVSPVPSDSEERLTARLKSGLDLLAYHSSNSVVMSMST